MAGHFIADRLGSAVQHLAFSCENIFETASKLEGTQFQPLVISPNYYEDLDARFALEGAFLDRLRSANILYDRDDDGEYLQFYSQSHGEGFFFEIIERRGGYRGYGAANAQFRISAQKRHMSRAVYS